MVTLLFSILHVRVINSYKSCFAFIGRILGTFHSRRIFYKAGILMKHVTQALLKIQIHLKGLATLCRIIFHTFLVS